MYQMVNIFYMVNFVGSPYEAGGVAGNLRPMATGPFDRIFRIPAAAFAARVSDITLRRWETHGVISTGATRADGEWRRYSEIDILHLRTMSAFSTVAGLTNAAAWSYASEALELPKDAARGEALSMDEVLRLLDEKVFAILPLYDRKGLYSKAFTYRRLSREDPIADVALSDGAVVFPLGALARDAIERLNDFMEAGRDA